MKCLVLIGDGMSDWPLQKLHGKTPLEAAKTPNLDHLAQNGVCGWVNNVPKGMEPASDVAAMSIFGYDPAVYYTGRGPLEAASLGVKIGKDEIAFRCNLVSVKDRKMESFTSHHISTPEGKRIMLALDRKIGGDGIRFCPGLSYRHLLIVNRKMVREDLRTTPPHDITGKKINAYLPKSDLLIKLMNESEVLLHGMKTKATMIWPWSQGRAPQMPLFKKRFGKKAAIITAVHLLKGLGQIVGMEVINVPGATGYIDTNYKGKAQYALKALKRNDVVFVHVEAPDEAGHEGSIPKKIRAIEDFDRLVVGTILNKYRIPNSSISLGTSSEFRIMVLPDHPTPIKIKTHSAEPVPFVIYPAPASGRPSIVAGYSEKEIKKSKLLIKNGYELLGKLIGGKL